MTPGKEYGFCVNDIKDADWYELIRRNDQTKADELRERCNRLTGKNDERDILQAVADGVIDIACDADIVDDDQGQGYLCALINAREKASDGGVFLSTYGDLILFPGADCQQAAEERLKTLARYMPTENISVSRYDVIWYTADDVRAIFFEMLGAGKFHTDSDMEDFRSEWKNKVQGPNAVDPWLWYAEMQAAGTRCQMKDGSFCRHIKCLPDFGVCCICSRNPRLRDAFERA